MSLSDRLKELIETPRNIGSEGIDIFAEINLDDVRRRTKLEENAKIDGGENVPQSESQTHSAVELDLKATFQQYQQKYLNDHASHQSLYSQRIAKAKECWDIEAVENEERGLVSDVIADAKARAGGVFDKQQMLMASAKELYDYRDHHGLLHCLPDTHDKFISYAMLVVFFTVELFVTVFYTREVAEITLVILSSTIICFLNCITPFLLGTPTRWIFYKPEEYSRWRVFGFLISIALLIGGLSLNLLMGHFRYATLEAQKRASEILGSGDIEALAEIAAIVANAGSRAMEQFMQNPFALQDVNSIILFSAGFIAFAMSWADGVFRMSDHYPEYGRKSESFSGPYEDYVEQIESILLQVKSDRRQAIKDIEREKQVIIKAIERVSEIISRAHALTPKCNNAINVLNARYQQLVAEYRQKNLASRNTPLPVYFNTPAELPSHELTATNHTGVESRKHTQLLEKLDSFSDRIHSEFEQVINKLELAQSVLKDKHPLRVVTTPSVSDGL